MSSTTGLVAADRCRRVAESVLVIALAAPLLGACSGGEEPSRDTEIAVQTAEAHLDAAELIASWSLTGVQSDGDEFERSTSFDRYFGRVGTIQLDDSILLASVRYVDIDADGDLLVYDLLASQVVLFESTGRAIAKLDPTECHPGYDFKPLHARFTFNGGILVGSNTSPSGFLFGPLGECLERVDLGTVHPRALVASNPRGYFVRSVDPIGYKTTRVATDGSERLVLEGDAHATLNHRVLGKNEMCAVGRRHLAVVERHSPFVSIVDTESGRVWRSTYDPPYFTEVEEEVETGIASAEEAMRRIRAVTDGRSTTHGVVPLTDTSFVALYRNSAGESHNLALEVYHVSGKRENSETIYMPFSPNSNLVGGGGGVLLREMPFANLDVDAGNPSLAVYRYASAVD